MENPPKFPHYSTVVHSSLEITELAKAMLQVQQSLLPAAKDVDNPFVKSKYATLNSVIDACRESLLANASRVAQYPVAVEVGHLGLVTKLVHAESGQWQTSLMVMPLPKADPQGYGSALTYARRYGLATMVGLERWVHFVGPLRGKFKVDRFIGLAALWVQASEGPPSGLRF